jgi:hypothetical protein
MVQVSEVGSWVAGMAGTTASPTVFVEVLQILQRWVALLRAPSSEPGPEWGPGLKAATVGRVLLGRKMQMIMTTELKKWSRIEIGQDATSILSGARPRRSIGISFSVRLAWWVFFDSEFIELLIPKVARCQPFRSMLCIA